MRRKGSHKLDLRLNIKFFPCLVIYYTPLSDKFSVFFKNKTTIHINCFLNFHGMLPI